MTSTPDTEEKKFKDFLENNVGKLTNCIITSCTVHDPIVASDGFIYEKTAFKEFCKAGYLKSPVTREDMSSTFKPIKLIANIIKFSESYDLETLEQKYITSNLFEDNVDIICEAFESNDFDVIHKFKSFKLDYLCSGLVPFITKILSYRPKNETLFQSICGAIVYMLDNCETLDFVLDDNRTILHICCCNAVFLNIIQYITIQLKHLQIFDKLNKPDNHDLLPVEYAIRRKDKVVIDTLLQLQFDFKPVMKTNIHYVIQYYDNFELIKQMINFTDNINEIYNGQIPIITAILYKKPDVVEYLLTKNADVTISPGNDNNAIHYAFKSNNNKIIKLIMNHVQTNKINLKKSIHKYIHNFIESLDDDQLIIQLLSTMQDVNEIHNEVTPLGTAIRYKKISIVKFLLENGANLKIHCYGEQDAIECALRYGNEEIINLILTNNPTTHIGIAHIFQLLQSDDNNSMILSLIDSVKDINESYNGYTLLGMAIYYRKIHVIKYLLDKGADMTQKYGEQSTNAIYKACREGNIEICKLLIDKCDNIDMEINDDGWRFIHAVCCFGKKELIEYMLSKNPTINVPIRKYNGKDCNYYPFNLIELNNNLNESAANTLIEILISLMQF